MEALKKTAAKDAAANFDSSVMQGAAASFNRIVNAAGGVLQVFDSGIYTYQLSNSSPVSQWTVAVDKQKIALNPAASTVDIGGDVSFKVDVLGVDSTLGYSYSWSTTGKVGDLSEVGGGNRRHQTQPPYCSSSNQAIFVFEPVAVAGATDTVSVDVFSGSNCAQGKGQLLGTGLASVTFKTSPVGISPQNPQVAQESTQNFVVTVSSGSFAAGTSFKWVLTGGLDLFGRARDLRGWGGGTIGVNATVPTSPGSQPVTSVTVTTGTPNITFAENSFGPGNGPHFYWTDQLNLAVSVLDSSGNVLESSSTLIQTQLPKEITLP
jgi:hypothetical protein